jgi:FrmR/RcnR family transcriptional regulator, repressor of frmRAB operon
MAHTVRDKEKLLRRVQRIIGQLEAVRRGLEDEDDCSDIMLVISAAHGAINSLMAEVVEGHIRHHMVDPDRRPTSAEARAAQELLDVVKAYVR